MKSALWRMYYLPFVNIFNAWDALMEPRHLVASSALVFEGIEYGCRTKNEF